MVLKINFETFKKFVIMNVLLLLLAAPLGCSLVLSLFNEGEEEEEEEED